ncbi:hypothetical protein FEM48_Zijuj04G0063500 [Ziziphus jujuba var. spinosa]|uniref:Serpin domain-containing protein n=1 Tax=Ziziphus jujuba var. spinosa TaxID=714518 RepID=A0A978VIA6_ZIZJJ|nr:hypothetical protein FEM48_Zijuj04G0063500 [Ziziphus jujuba var. spinosa]
MKEMGLKLPFEARELTEMVDGPNSDRLYVSDTFHKSHIEVNEEGTETAASTAAAFRFVCATFPTPSFVADHPFMFMIREEIHGMVFFVGAVLNPLLDIYCISLYIKVNEEGTEAAASTAVRGSKGQTLQQLLHFLGSSNVNDLNLLSSKILSTVASPDENLEGGPLLSMGSEIRSLIASQLRDFPLLNGKTMYSTKSHIEVNEEGTEAVSSTIAVERR